MVQEGYTAAHDKQKCTKQFVKKITAEELTVYHELQRRVMIAERGSLSDKIMITISLFLFLGGTDISQ